MHIRNQNFPKCVPWNIRLQHVTFCTRQSAFSCLLVLYSLSLPLKYSLQERTGSSGWSCSLPQVHRLKQCLPRIMCLRDVYLMRVQWASWRSSNPETAGAEVYKQDQLQVTMKQEEALVTQTLTTNGGICIHKFKIKLAQFFFGLLKQEFLRVK